MLLTTNMELFLRPPPLPQWNFPSIPLPRAIYLPSPIPVLLQSDLGIRRIVEVDLRNRSLDERPYSPVQARNSPVEIDFRVQPTGIRGQVGAWWKLGVLRVGR